LILISEPEERPKYKSFPPPPLYPPPDPFTSDDDEEEPEKEEPKKEEPKKEEPKKEEPKKEEPKKEQPAQKKPGPRESIDIVKEPHHQPPTPGSGTTIKLQNNHVVSVVTDGPEREDTSEQVGKPSGPNGTLGGGLNMLAMIGGSSS
jgi:hypothetical protein